LLDTHVALWAITNSPKLSAAARAIIVDAENVIHVSVVSLWEIAIKHALKRKGSGAMPVSARRAEGYFQAAGYVLTPIHASLVLTMESLPSLHADPFDRMLVAQAISEPLRLVTHDEELAPYGSAVTVV
jgi:PIN domain nuclease of toxin-antitoxin system